MELAEKIKMVFPFFHLEDKVTLQKGGIVTDPSSKGDWQYRKITPFQYTCKRRGNKITEQRE